MELTYDLSRPSGRRSGLLGLELRTPAGVRSHLVGIHGLGPPLTRRHVRPDVVLVGEVVALEAVLGGFIAPLEAAREGQLEVIGELDALVRLGRLLARSLVA
jgi:hypothetical protein